MRKSQSPMFRKMSKEIEILYAENILDFGYQKFKVKILLNEV